MKPTSAVSTVLFLLSLGCDHEPTVQPTAASTGSRKLWCQGQEQDPEQWRQLIPSEQAREQYFAASGCVWGDAPPMSEPAAVSTVPPADYKLPVATEVGDGSLVMHFVVDVGGTFVPVRYTVDPSTRTHPDYVAARERLAAAGAALGASHSTDPNHAQVVADDIEAMAEVRLVMRDLGDTDSALGVAVMILGTMTQNASHLSAIDPDRTSLVATFPDAGTGYCNEITRGIPDQVTRVQIYGDCTAAELNHFMIVETLADAGRWADTRYCVSISQLHDGIGSYKLLAECLRDKAQRE